MSDSKTSVDLAQEIVLYACQANLQPGTMNSVHSSLHQKSIALKNNCINQDLAKLAVYFADDVMNRQANNLGQIWTSIEQDGQVFGTGQGAKDFYTITNQYLGKTDPDGRAVQEFAFRCLALGFLGDATDINPRNADTMRALKDTLKIREGQAIVFSEREHQPDERQLWKKPTRWLRWIGLGALAAGLGLLVAYFGLFANAHAALDSILPGLPQKYSIDP